MNLEFSHFGHDMLEKPSPRHDLKNTMERVRFILSECAEPWFEILETTPKRYFGFILESEILPEKALENLARYVGVDICDLLLGNLDFQLLAIKFSKKTALPGQYAYAAFGRRRTSSTSIDFLEAKQGWRFRGQLLHYFGISEAVLADPFGKISMKFITDLCGVLSQHGFMDSDFFSMGAYSYVGNKNSLLGRLYSQCRHPLELYHLIFGQHMAFYEQNCRYDINRLTPSECWIDVRSIKEVADALGVKHLGNRQVCQLKAGFMACAPLYMGLPVATVVQTSCVHDGDSFCRFKINFETATKILTGQERSA
jgi:hypothetical protein